MLLPPTPEQAVKFQPQSTEDTTQEIALDEFDGVRLENLLLRRQVELLQQELETLRREEASRALNDSQVEFHTYLVGKYGVDTVSNKMVVNAKDRTLVITPNV